MPLVDVHLIKEEKRCCLETRPVVYSSLPVAFYHVYFATRSEVTISRELELYMGQDDEKDGQVVVGRATFLLLRRESGIPHILCSCLMST